MTQKGGKFIGQGAYGCAFDPPLKCKEKRAPPHRAIGKVFKDDKNFKEEQKNAILLQKTIDPVNQFTVPFLGACKINRKDQTAADQIESCSLMDASRAIYSQVFYGEGGKDLDFVMKHMSAHYPDLHVDDLFIHIVPILEGIHKINAHGYLHGDIKPPNILLTKADLRISLIDFGLMQKLDALHTLDWMLDWTYPYYPPEFKILQTQRTLPHMASNPTFMTSHILQNFASLHETELFRFSRGFLGSDLRKQLERCVHDSIHTPNAKYAERFRAAAPVKADVYSLGISLLEMFFRMHQDGVLRVRNVAFVKECRGVLAKMVHMDMERRLLPGAAAEAFRALLEKHHIRTPKSRPHIDSGDFARLYQKDLAKCGLSEAKGGYAIKELREIAVQLGIGAKKRADICEALRRMSAKT